MFLIPNIINSDVLGFFADFDKVPLAVTDFEELCIATVLNRSGENTTACEVLVPFLQLVAENDRNDWRGSIEARLLHLSFGIQKDCGRIVTRKLEGDIGRQLTVPIRRNSCRLAIKRVDPPTLGTLNICVGECD